VSNESNPEWIIRGLIGAIKNDKRCGSGDVEKTFGPEKWSRCVKLSKDAGVGGGSEVGEKAGDGVEDRIDVGVGVDVGGGTGVVIGLRAGICVVGSGVCASSGCLRRVFKLGCSSWVDQVGVLCEFRGFHSLME
jgi:hypothetical protein